MDVSIAVSLIRGQMGAVVERAVNGAVETVLAEMLKVVGVKFEELKAQVALMKQDVAALHREKALKEIENENIRAKLRYTELKLKYYRQGVEEELQQRASASALVCIDPSKFHKGNSGVCSIEKSSPCTTESKSSEGQLMRSIQGSPQFIIFNRCLELYAMGSQSFLCSCSQNPPHHSEWASVRSEFDVDPMQPLPTQPPSSCCLWRHQLNPVMSVAVQVPSCRCLCLSVSLSLCLRVDCCLFPGLCKSVAKTL